MRKLLTTAAVAFLTVSPALARDQSITTSCYHDRYSVKCRTILSEPSAPITYTAEEIAAIKAREDEWATYCKPHDEVGKDGLLRAVYAHKDCDIGVYKPGQRGE